MVTIATHNGSRVARDHNIRNEKVTSKEKHIRADGLHEIWVDEKPQEAYERLFGEAIKQYNERQSRPERKIKNYYKQIQDDKKKHTVYEMIIGVYPEKNEKISVETQREILKEFVDSWKKRNPNLYMCGAYFHADEEGEPHVHIDYIPVAHGYIKGMETQTGLVRALEEQGFVKEGKLTSQIKWEARENQTLENICREHGIKVTHPKREKQKHRETEEYKAEQQALEKIEHLNSTIAKKDKELLEIATVKKPGIFNKGNTVVFNENMYESLKKRLEASKKDREYVDRKLKEAEKYYNEAQKQYKIATHLVNNEKDYIIQQSQEAFNQFIQKKFKKEIGGRSERLERYCDSLTMSNGQTILEKFNELEEERKTRLERAWDEREDEREL